MMMARDLAMLALGGLISYFGRRRIEVYERIALATFRKAGSLERFLTENYTAPRGLGMRSSRSAGTNSPSPFTATQSPGSTEEGGLNHPSSLVRSTGFTRSGMGSDFSADTFQLLSATTPSQAPEGDRATVTHSLPTVAEEKFEDGGRAHQEQLLQQQKQRLGLEEKEKEKESQDTQQEAAASSGTVPEPQVLGQPDQEESHREEEQQRPGLAQQQHQQQHQHGHGGHRFLEDDPPGVSSPDPVTLGRGSSSRVPGVDEDDAERGGGGGGGGGGPGDAFTFSIHHDEASNEAAEAAPAAREVFVSNATTAAGTTPGAGSEEETQSAARQVTTPAAETQTAARQVSANEITTTTTATTSSTTGTMAPASRGHWIWGPEAPHHHDQLGGDQEQPGNEEDPDLDKSSMSFQMLDEPNTPAPAESGARREPDGQCHPPPATPGAGGFGPRSGPGQNHHHQRRRRRAGSSS
jgi:hypothetical protein